MDLSKIPDTSDADDEMPDTGDALAQVCVGGGGPASLHEFRPEGPLIHASGMRSYTSTPVRHGSGSYKHLCRLRFKHM